MNPKPIHLNGTTIAKLYEPTPDEEAAMELFHRRKNKTPQLKAVQNQGRIELSLKHPDPVYGQMLLMKAIATNELPFFGEIMTELGTACSNGTTVNETRVNFMLAVIKGIEPQDQLETMLAAQMAAIHTLTMDFTSRLANAENSVQRESAATILNKLTRTFVAQLEALKRYRTGGEQHVTVRHLSINDGGQAIVGNLNGRAGPSKKGESTP